MNHRTKIALIGLGYVGLPLAVEFAKKYKVIGFDISSSRVSQLKKLNDNTNEVDKATLKSVIRNLTITDNLEDIRPCNFYIVTVPTPILNNKLPDLSYLKSASKLIGSIIKKNDIIVYESTVFPGATKEVCVPILENSSLMILNKDFFVGYSPERINPGDKLHRVADIKKIISGSNKRSAVKIKKVYSSIIKAGTFMASSIEVAEAAKVIENTQRDLNIALMNELSIIFNKMSIDTQEVIQAAATKWNFAEYYPGFVGGHCIGVDPYYLTYKAQSLGYDPKVILGGRKLNDGMTKHVAKTILSKYSASRELKILVMGFTFKENCPDTRNTKIDDLVKQLSQSGKFINTVHVYDPWLDLTEAENNFPKIAFVTNPREKFYDLVIIAVNHKKFKRLGVNKIRSYAKNKGEIWDLKYTFDKHKTDHRI